jgi:hypothetical protein
VRRRAVGGENSILLQSWVAKGKGAAGSVFGARPWARRETGGAAVGQRQ